MNDIKCPYPKLDCANKLSNCRCKILTDTDFGGVVCPFYINRIFNEARVKKHDYDDVIIGVISRKYKRYIKHAKKDGNFRLENELWNAAIRFEIEMDHILKRRDGNAK